MPSKNQKAKVKIEISEMPRLPLQLVVYPNPTIANASELKPAVFDIVEFKSIAYNPAFLQFANLINSSVYNYPKRKMYIRSVYGVAEITKNQLLTKSGQEDFMLKNAGVLLQDSSDVNHLEAIKDANFADLCGSNWNKNAAEANVSALTAVNFASLKRDTLRKGKVLAMAINANTRMGQLNAAISALPEVQNGLAVQAEQRQLKAAQKQKQLA